MFGVNIDDEDGLGLEPGPVLEPQNLDAMPDAALAGPLMPPVAAMPVMASPIAQAPQPPTPPTAPIAPDAMHKIVSMALLGLAAGLGPRHGGGIPQGLLVGQHANDLDRQTQFRNEQLQYQQQQANAIREEQIREQNARAEAAIQERRQHALQQALMSIRGEVKTIPDKAEYDKRIEGYAGILQGSGYRLDANWLRQAIPFVAPSGKQLAQDGLKAFLSNPMNQTAFKENPDAVAKGSMKIDLNGDGVAELVPIARVMEAAGMSSILNDQGEQIGLAPTTEGPAFNIALKTKLRKFRADNRREPDAKEMDALVTEARKTPRAVPPADAGGSSDVDEIVDAIIDGTQPPDMGRMYGKTAAVKAGLHRKGYDLTSATLDWQATQKWIATANGSQQIRMRQGVDNAYHSLDVIDQLAERWKAGRYPLLTKGRLVAAKQGALGPEAAKIATLLDAQIADVTSELGNVYMGGNSPTDHALELASKNLSSDWSWPTLKSAVEQSRTNLRIRQNSMRNTGPVSPTGRDNPYVPPPAPTPAPAAPLVNPFRKP